MLHTTSSIRFWLSLLGDAIAIAGIALMVFYLRDAVGRLIGVVAILGGVYVVTDSNRRRRQRTSADMSPTEKMGSYLRIIPVWLAWLMVFGGVDLVGASLIVMLLIHNVRDTGSALVGAGNALGALCIIYGCAIISSRRGEMWVKNMSGLRKIHITMAYISALMVCVLGACIALMVSGGDYVYDTPWVLFGLLLSIAVLGIVFIYAISRVVYNMFR